MAPPAQPLRLRTNSRACPAQVFTIYRPAELLGGVRKVTTRGRSKRGPPCQVRRGLLVNNGVVAVAEQVKPLTRQPLRSPPDGDSAEPAEFDRRENSESV